MVDLVRVVDLTRRDGIIRYEYVAELKRCIGGDSLLGEILHFVFRGSNPIDNWVPGDLWCSVTDLWEW